MTVNKDFFEPSRAFNYDFQSSGATPEEWNEATRAEFGHSLEVIERARRWGPRTAHSAACSARCTFA